ncbi:hypothetical protein ABCR94_06010 [Streptomyces sp. 21So2-11]|uniref:hypothetical protein n=1 Tax=Streptomyces sp. 21So2-11 TaxID=3144408 RepID=UPI0032198349
MRTRTLAHRLANHPLVLAQDGLATTGQLLALGSPWPTITNRCRPDGPWQRVLPRVVLLRPGSPTPHQRLRAALLYAGEDALLTGPAALALYAVRAAPPLTRVGPVDVLVPNAQRPRGHSYVRIQRTRRPSRRLPVQGLPCAPLLRAVSCTVPRLTDGERVTALLAELVQRGRCTVEELLAELRAAKLGNAPGVANAMEALTAGVRSIAEAQAREALRAGGIPDALWNPTLRTLGGEFLARPDAYWPREGVALEVDSEEFHLGPAEYRATLRRRLRLEAHGVEVVSVAPAIVRDHPAELLAAVAAKLRRGEGRAEPPRVVVEP